MVSVNPARLDAVGEPMASEQLQSDVDCDRAKILLVDDRPANLRLLTDLLLGEGYEVRRAPSGRLALSALQDFRADLILLDIMMPEMDGFAVCEQLKKSDRTRHISIIFLSAVDTDFEKIRAFRLGAVDYITKPLREAEVLIRIEHHLRLQALQSQLRQAEERYRGIFENALEGLFQSTPQGQFLSANLALAETLGYESPQALIANITDIASQVYVRANRRAELTQAMGASGRISRVESQVYRNDGSVIWISESMRAIADARGHLLRYEGNVRDITERKLLEQALFEEKELAQVTLQSIGDAVITTDACGRVTNFNPIAARLTGWTYAEAIGQSLSQIFNIVHERTREPAPNPIEQTLREEKIVGLADRTVLIARDGTERAIQDSAAPIRSRDGTILGAVMVFQDVTTERALARQLSWQAEHDVLTGLHNRLAFERCLEESLASARRDRAAHVLCYLDLDRFKIVNDTVGHAAGDELLRQVAALFQQRVRPVDMVARLGGDEFGALLRDCTLPEAREIAERLRACVREFEFCWQGKCFRVGVSIGLVAIDRASHDLERALSEADAACYAAKERGRNCVHVYRGEDRDLARQRGDRRWLARINEALTTEMACFCLYRQKISALDPSEQQARYEILLRMHDDRGQPRLVSPVSFLPTAERYGLMPAIDRWVVRMVLAHHRAVQGSAACQAMCFINLSGTSFNSEPFIDFLKAELAANPQICPLLCFEITETAAIADLRKTARTIAGLRALGCHFALDDFGSGMSSFAYLKELPIDYLKIDGSLVRDIATNEVSYALVECINRMGQVTGKKTVAEFVEDGQILEKLRAIGVDYAQGYGIDRPQPLPD